MASTMIRRQRASSQPNLVQYATQHCCDPSIQSSLFLAGQYLDRQPVASSSPSTPTAQTAHLARQRSHPQSLKQSASLPHHGRLHRQLTPHMSLAHPASPTAASVGATPAKHVPARPINRTRSFLLPHVESPPVAPHIPAMRDSMSSCSGFSSELTNAIEHQSASVRNSTDSFRSNMRRSCSHPNSLDMSRSSAETTRSNIDPSLLTMFCGASSNHKTSAMAACHKLAADALERVESEAFGEGACNRAEAVEACSKLSKSSCLQYTASAYPPSIPSLVVSACASDECLNRSSEGTARSPGASQPLRAPASGSQDGVQADKSSMQLPVQRDSGRGVQKARDPHGHPAASRRSIGSLDIARQVQQYAADLGDTAAIRASASSAPGELQQVGSTRKASHEQPRQQRTAQVQSHALAMSSALFQPSNHPAPSLDAAMRTAVPASQPGSQPFPKAMPALPHNVPRRSGTYLHTLDSLKEEPATIVPPTELRVSDVSESDCTIIPPPAQAAGCETQASNPFSTPEVAATQSVAQPQAQRIAFSSALFKPAVRVPSHPSTARGGFPQAPAPSAPYRADSIDDQGTYTRHLVLGHASSRMSLGGRPSESSASEGREECRFRERSIEPGPGSLRTSVDPVARPSTDSAFELDLEMRVARSRQTMDFAARQRVRFGSLSFARLTIMEALALMETLPRTSGQQASSLSATSYAFLCAQWCIHEFPGRDWAPLVGLMHDLGRLLLHPKFGSEPAWAVTSESYPLGCRFSESISGYFFLHACPDRRCSAYAKPTGIYTAQCGLDATHFSWTGPEYLSLVAAQNGVRLPLAANFLLRYQNFDSAIEYGAYSHLMSEDDVRCLPLLRKFTAVRKAAIAGAGPPRACSRTEVVAKCEAAIKKYFPQPQLRF